MAVEQPVAPAAPARDAGPARKGPSDLRALLPVFGLAFTAFIFNTSEFMPIGLLTDIGADFSMTSAQTGAMISIYAWAVMLLSLPLMVAASRFEYKRLMLAVVALFGAGQVCSFIAPTFPLLVAARILVACAHAVFWSIVAPMAVRAVPDRLRTLALSLVNTGTSVAMILGMPLGRMVGLALGWRCAFLCVAVCAVVAFAYLACLLPRLGADEPFELRRLPGLLRDRRLLGVYLVIVLLALGYYTAYSYIEPFLLQVAGMPEGLVTATLTVFGVAGIAGSLLYARVFDGHGAAFIRLVVAGMGVSILLLLPATGLGAAGPMAACALWGLCATSYNVALQGEMIKFVEPSACAVAMSIYSGLFNMGIGCGSALGGAVVDGVSISAVGLVGGAVCLVAAAYTALRLVPMLMPRR